MAIAAADTGECDNGPMGVKEVTSGCCYDLSLKRPKVGLKNESE